MSWIQKPSGWLTPEDLLVGNKLFVVSPHSDLPENAVLFVNGDVFQEGGATFMLRHPYHDDQGSLLFFPVMVLHPKWQSSMCLTLRGAAGTTFSFENSKGNPVVVMDSEGIPHNGIA